MLQKKLEKCLLIVFTLVLFSSCTPAPNLIRAQKSPEDNTSIPATPTLPQAAGQTPEQVVRMFIEIGLRKDRDFRKKEKQAEECCVTAAEQFVPPKKEANIEYLKKKNPAVSYVVGLDSLFDELTETKVRCQTEQSAIIDATLRFKGKERQSTSYFILTKQNDKWLIEDVSVLEIPKCPS